MNTEAYCEAGGVNECRRGDEDEDRLFGVVRVIFE